MRRPVLLAAVLLTACSTGTSPVQACVEHAVEEGVDAPAARTACEEAVGDGG